MVLPNIELNTVGLLVVAIMNAATLYYTRKTEKNTNSMKDQLVASTATASHQEGREEMRVESEARAASVADGVLQGKNSKP